MNKIFIEAKDKEKPECHFLKAIISHFFPGKEIDFICMDGIGNLFKEAIRNQMAQAEESGDIILVLADADTIAKGYGYKKRKTDIDNGMSCNGVTFPYFLYPNNHDDGDVETLMEKAARRDLHPTFFDCFEDYEKCVSGKKDKSGQPLYNVPDLKGKLHTYMNAQKLSGKQRSRLGSGDWLFDDNNYWDLTDANLQPLKDFLSSHLK